MLNSSIFDDGLLYIYVRKYIAIQVLSGSMGKMLANGRQCERDIMLADLEMAILAGADLRGAARGCAT